MLRHWISKLPGYSDSKASIVMILSALCGQFINFLALPLVLGLYGAAAFGDYSLILSYVSVVVVLGTLQLEQAIPTIKSDQAARDLLSALFVWGCSLAIIAGLIVSLLLIFNVPINGFLKGSTLAAFVFVAVIISEVTFVLSRSWLVRKGVFGPIASAQFIRPIIFVAAAIAFGYAISLEKMNVDNGGAYLVLATLISGGVAAWLMTVFVARGEKDGLNSFAGIISPIEIFRRFRAISKTAIAQIVFHVASQMPIWIVAISYPGEKVGWLALAMRLTMFPVALNNNSIASVLNNRISKRVNKGIPILGIVRKSIIGGTLVGFLGYCTLYALVASGIFRVFGKDWILAGTTIQIFCLFGFSQYIFSFVRFVPIAAGRDAFFLRWNYFRFFAYCIAALYCLAGQPDYVTSITLLVVVEFLTISVFLLLEYFNGSRTEANSD